MVTALPDDLAAVVGALDAVDGDARRLTTGLDEDLGTWQAEPGSWSVAQCLDHLAVANRTYLAAMRPSAAAAGARGRVRRGPARPGLVGRIFVALLEPPVRTISRGKAPAAIRPRPSPTLGDALAAFLAAQDDVRAFVQANAGLDLAGTTFPNPFITGVRFSLATALHVMAAHGRRHLWQAWRVRRAAMQARARAAAPGTAIDAGGAA
jgi:hypothetical protein